jgi:uncharacterized protein YndB with AHSA1/START domain
MAAERSRTTKASPDRVWTIWSDTSTWPHWNPDVEAVSLKGPFQTGSRGEMTTRSGGRHDILIDDVEPGRTFTVDSTGVPTVHLRFRCEVAPEGEGSRISQSVSMRGGLAFIFQPLMSGRIANSFSPLLDGLAAYAEKEGG